MERAPVSALQCGQLTALFSLIFFPTFFKNPFDNYCAVKWHSHVKGFGAVVG